MNTIRFTESLYSELIKYLFNYKPKEAAAYILAGYFKNIEGLHFTAKKIFIPDIKDYTRQSEIHLEISPVFINKVISNAEYENLAIIICHSHPSSVKLFYSYSDDFGEKKTSNTFYDCLNKKPTGSLLFGLNNNIIGRIWIDPKKKPILVNQIRIVGRNIRFQNINKRRLNRKYLDLSLYSRQILALGKEGQVFLSNLKLGIVGLGATGSCIAEQLVRLGVTNLVLIDKDIFEISNKTRMYGTYSRTKFEPKVKIIEKHLKKINPNIIINKYNKDVINQSIIKKLSLCDIIFSCTDRHAPRSILNELCYQCYIPLIDVGVGLISKQYKIDHITVRASVISPGLPCMFCQEIIKERILYAETLNPEERKKQIQEGYIRNYLINAPSVISYTTIASGFGVSIFLDMLFGFSNINSYNYYLDLLNYDLIKICAKDNPECICKTRSGRGFLYPFSAPY